MPEPSHSPVSVHKRVNKLHFIMEHTTLDNRVIFIVLQVIEQVVHQVVYSRPAWCEVCHRIPLKNADIARSIPAGRFYEPRRKQFMSLQIRFLLVRIKLRQFLIHPDRVLNLQNIFRRPGHSFIVEQGTYLIQRQGITLDAQRRMDGFDLVLLPQMRGSFLRYVESTMPSNLPASADRLMIRVVPS